MLPGRKSPPQISPGGESVMGDDPPAPHCAALHRYILQPGCAAPPQAPIAAVAAALLKIFTSLLKLRFASRPPAFLFAPRERQIFLKVPVQ